MKICYISHTDSVNVKSSSKKAPRGRPGKKREGITSPVQKRVEKKSWNTWFSLVKKTLDPLRTS